MKAPLKVIAFLSGRGSNFKSLLDRQRSTTPPSYEIVGVYSDKPGAAGLFYANDAGIPVHSFFRSDFSSLELFKRAIFEHADTSGADLAVLAGYMQIVPDWFIKRWAGRMINIHPSLLPKYPGLETHKRALEAHDIEHGCSVHIVDSDVDSGAVIAQAKVTIDPGDTPESLSAKVLVEEHKIYPWVVSQIADGHISIACGKVSMNQTARHDAASAGFFLP